MVRMKLRARLFSLVLLLFVATLAQAQQAALFLVRHADKLSDASDALLSPRGHARAECLAQTFKDAKLSAIYATEVVRTQQTAAPLAKRSGVTETILPKADLAALLGKLKSAQGIVLVVSHADVLPSLIAALGAGKIPAFADHEYDRLLLVPLTEGKAGPPITLRYCPNLH